MYRVIKKYPYVGNGICMHHWLDWKYPGHWIGRHGPVEWKPRSPDLITLDFLLVEAFEGHGVPGESAEYGPSKRTH